MGFITLFLELALIRYLAGNVWNLGYFPNIVLLSVFVGMGIGFVFHHHFSERTSNALYHVALAVLAFLVVFVYFKHPVVPGFEEPWYSDVDGDLYFSSVVFEVHRYNYLFFALCFVLVVITFAFISQRTAKLFRLFPPLTAYTLDIAGSCIGILAFMLLSATQCPAWSWFVILSVVFPFTMPSRTRKWWIPLALGLIVAAVALRQDGQLMRDPDFGGPLQVHWSPYQKVEYVVESPELKQMIYVNGLNHQQILSEVKTTIYREPYLWRTLVAKRPPYRSVLVIGAGSGNDVAAALSYGALHVDAVEIDPVIAELGKKYNRLKPYQDERVNLIIDDGRAFLTRTDRKYDLIIFALTDSLVKVSSLSQLRLENYLFTQESVQRAYDLLTDGGDILFYNFYRLPFVVQKITTMLEEVTGRPPEILHHEYGAGMFAMLIGGKSGVGGAFNLNKESGVETPTDDWPFLYLKNRNIPVFYLKAMAGVFVFLTALLVLLHMTTKNKEGYGGRGMLLIKLSFVLMGIAFLVLETKSVIQFSLLFGTTWLNNSLIFLAVLLLVLVANWTAAVIENTRPILWTIYGLLLLSSLFPLLYPLSNLLNIESTFVRFIAASLMTFSPIYFANLIFSLTFKDQKIAEHIFGWNLLGATFGGILEYGSMAWGYNVLSFLIAICYSAVFFMLLVARRRME
jgi:spermidine synthase